MKQVQLKIEEFFDGNISTAYTTDNKELMQPIRMIFNKRTHKTSMTSEISKLNKNESRETIIQALWEYQKSLLTKKYRLESHYKLGRSRLFEMDGQLSLFICYFYNPETRIITITQFSEEV